MPIVTGMTSNSATWQESNRPVVLSGPSGAGKSTLIKRLMDEFPGKYRFSVSHTTRKPRNGEVDGIAYHFVDRQGFLDLVGKGGFIEYTESYTNLYGTSVMAVEDAMRLKESRCLLDVDSQGVINIKKSYSHLNPLYVFICPPSLGSLAKRLGGRGSETEETMRARLSMARGEVEYAATGVYDTMVVNDDVDRAYALFRDIMLTGRTDGDKLPNDILS